MKNFYKRTTRFQFMREICKSLLLKCTKLNTILLPHRSKIYLGKVLPETYETKTTGKYLKSEQLIRALKPSGIGDQLHGTLYLMKLEKQNRFPLSKRKLKIGNQLVVNVGSAKHIYTGSGISNLNEN